MTRLDTKFMGLLLKNPVIVASGPWAGDATGIQACIDAGAGAVMTETISQEVYRRCSPRIYCRDGEVLSTSLYGTLSLEDWESEMEKIQKMDCKLIASIRGSTPSELAYIARKVERMGFDGLQLDLYAPIGSMIFGLNNDAEQLVSLIAAVKAEVSVPVLVRLPHYVSDNVAFMRALEKAGTDGICTTESIRGILGVDIERARPLMPTHGGYTGRHMRPVTLAAIAALSQVSDLPISATGGMENYENIIEAIQLGATTVQLGSAIMIQGYSLIEDTVFKLRDWMEAHGYEEMERLRGKALEHLHSYEELDSTPRVAAITHGPCCAGCRICENACLGEAITPNALGLPEVCPTRCNGCGLCLSQCPHRAIHLVRS